MQENYKKTKVSENLKAIDVSLENTEKKVETFDDTNNVTSNKSQSDTN